MSRDHEAYDPDHESHDEASNTSFHIVNFLNVANRDGCEHCKPPRSVKWLTEKSVDFLFGSRIGEVVNLLNLAGQPPSTLPLPNEHPELQHRDHPPPV